MGLIILLDGERNGLLLLLLVGALALTVWDCMQYKLPFKQTAWWVSVVLLLHVVGYGILRLWLLAEHRRSPQEGTV